MLHVTVTGKVGKVEQTVGQTGETQTVVLLNERRYAGGEEIHYTWVVLCPKYLDKAVARLCKENKSIGFTANDLWPAPKNNPLPGTVQGPVIQAEQVFIL